MKGTTHLSVGISAGVMIGMLYYEGSGGITDIVLITSGAALGSLLPDIDHPESRIGRIIPLIPNILNRSFGHRGFFHSPFFLMILGILLSFLIPISPPLFNFGIVLGFGLHLLLDMLNPMGVPLLYPYKKKIHVAKIHSSSPIQVFISVGCIFAAIIMVVWF